MSSQWRKGAARALALLRVGPIRLGEDGRWRFGASVVSREAVQAILASGRAERAGDTITLSAASAGPAISPREKSRERVLRGWETRLRNRRAMHVEE